MFVGAVIAGILTALFTEWIRGFGKVDEGASMGVVFTSLFALGLVMIVQAADHVDLDPGCVHNDKLLSLRDGRIIAVGENKKYMPDSNDHNGYVGLTFYSDDQGHSWHSSKNTVDLYGTRKIEVQEADAVELKDGRLMMFARSYSGYPVRAYSTDRGETWAEGKLIRDLKMPYAGLPTVRRIPSTGDLLFIWVSEKSTIEENGRKLPLRSALTTAISRDEGKTFLHQRNIVQDPTNDFGYQCIEFIDDDLALIAYHTNDGLHLARINVDWFYGEQVDP